MTEMCDGGELESRVYSEQVASSQLISSCMHSIAPHRKSG